MLAALSLGGLRKSFGASVVGAFEIESLSIKKHTPARIGTRGMRSYGPSICHSIGLFDEGPLQRFRVAVGQILANPVGIGPEKARVIQANPGRRGIGDAPGRRRHAFGIHQRATRLRHPPPDPAADRPRNPRSESGAGREAEAGFGGHPLNCPITGELCRYISTLVYGVFIRPILRTALARSRY